MCIRIKRSKASTNTYKVQLFFYFICWEKLLLTTAMTLFDERSESTVVNWKNRRLIYEYMVQHVHFKFQESWEIRAWQCSRIRGCQNIVRLEFPQNTWSLKFENTGRERISLKFLKSWHLWGRRGYSCSDFGNFGEVRSLPMFSHIRLQEFWGNSIPVDVFASEAAQIRCLQKASSGGSWGGAWAIIYIYIHT